MVLAITMKITVLGYSEIERDVQKVPVPQHCGKSPFHNEHKSRYGSRKEKLSKKPSKRIIGGLSSRSGEWPWLISLHWNTTKTVGYKTK